MTSWRDQTSEQAQADLDGLLGAALQLAQHLLGQNHEFYPFAAAITSAGDLEMIAGRPSDTSDDKPSSAVVLASCEGVLHSRRPELRAAALITDVRTPNGEAVRIDLEHLEGTALQILLPYTRYRLGRVKDFGELQASDGARRLWGADQS